VNGKGAEGGASCHTSEAEIEEEERPEIKDGRIVKKRPLLVFVGIVAVLSLILVLASAVAYSTVGPSSGYVQLADGATVYYNSACGDCAMYLQDTLIPTLKEQGVNTTIVKDWTNHMDYRKELFTLHEQYGVDASMRSHFTTFLKTDRLMIFEGHVPGTLISQTIALNDSSIRKIVISVWDDGMSGGPPPKYAAWAFVGSPQEYGESTPVATYATWLQGQNLRPWTSESDQSLLPIVAGAGFLDGLNPCAFAVLLFFVSLLFATRAPIRDTVKMGAIYIYAIFVVYFMIGLGLLGAIVLSPDPHFMAKVGAVLMLVVGGITIANYFLPKIPMPFHMPQKTWDVTRKWMKRATLPGALVAGLLVGLCTFPCSGTIYVFVLGLLASQTSFLPGLGYLYVYNLFFILPLVAVLAAIVCAQYVTKRSVARGFARWERAHSAQFRLMAGVVMIVFSIGFFAWAVAAG